MKTYCESEHQRGLADTASANDDELEQVVAGLASKPTIL